MVRAATDLRAAENSKRTGSHEWACFQAQQAAEKALKAAWLANGFEPWGLTFLYQDKGRLQVLLDGDVSHAGLVHIHMAAGPSAGAR